MSQIIVRRVAVTVEVGVEKRSDGFYYATTRWAAKSKNGTVLVRSKDKNEAVDACLIAAGYSPLAAWLFA